MESFYDIRRKIEQARKFFEAGTVLFNQNYVKECVPIYWISVRLELFYWLEKNEVEFSGTQSAISAAINMIDDLHISHSLIFVYTVGTLSEWDEDFVISQAQAKDFSITCQALSKFFRK